MRILIADDDNITRLILARMVTKIGYEPVVTCNGAEAWHALQQEDAPHMALLDWMMPQMDGLEVCRAIRQNPRTSGIYTILVTGKGERKDIVEGLEQGADDYITKPFDQHNLAARIRAAVRIVETQDSLTQKIRELELALSLVKRLEGIIPICCYCKSVRTDEQYWQSVDSYIKENSEANVSHGICPSCYQTVVAPQLEEYERQSGEQSDDSQDRKLARI
jgi:CheY-like chemotaxis protein